MFVLVILFSSRLIAKAISAPFCDKSLYFKTAEIVLPYFIANTNPVFNPSERFFMTPKPAHSFGFDTKALHSGYQPDAATGARAVPIYQSTSFVFENSYHAANLFALQ